MQFCFWLGVFAGWVGCHGASNNDASEYGTATGDCVSNQLIKKQIIQSALGGIANLHLVVDFCCVGVAAFEFRGERAVEQLIILIAD